MRLLLGATVTVVVVLGAASAVFADEAKTPISAAMILNIVAAPVETSRTTAFDEALKQPAPAATDTTAGEVLADGSVRYGRTVITVKNPCPPGTIHHDPPVLPGRRAGRR